MEYPHIVERAIALARSGRVRNLAELEKALKQEGYSQVPEHLRGPTFRLQLRALMKEAGAAVADGA